MKKIEKLGVQLFTVRDFMTNEKDIAETFKKLKALGYDQGQTAGCAVPYEVYGELAEKAGIEIVGTHDNFNMMLNDFDQALKNHQALNTKLMGIGGALGTPEERCVEGTLKFIEAANTVGERFSRYGGKFTYHHHQREFVKLENGKIIMEMLAEGMHPENTSFVLDTYWVQTGGGDICDWIAKLSGRIDILHLKDMMIDNASREQKYAEIGNGNMNWEKILTAAGNSGVKYYVVEQDHCPGDPFDSLKMSSDYMHKYFM